MTNRTFDIFMGGASFVSGVLILISPKPTFLRSFSPVEFGVDLSSIKWLLGPMLIIIGLGVMTKTLKSKPYKITAFKCPYCGKLYQKDDLTAHKCESCNNFLERLEGFFDRHPEFKDKEE